jgi:carbonic anhydrase
VARHQSRTITTRGSAARSLPSISLLDKIKPAVAATRFDGDRSSENYAVVDAVARTNVTRTVEEIRRQSSVLAGLESSGKIKIVGSMYHLEGGRVEFYV